MTDDPIVDEVHRVRVKMLEDCNGDLDELMGRLEERESEDRNRVVKNLQELAARTLPLAS